MVISGVCACTAAHAVSAATNVIMRTSVRFIKSCEVCRILSRKGLTEEVSRAARNVRDFHRFPGDEFSALSTFRDSPAYPCLCQAQIMPNGMDGTIQDVRYFLSGHSSKVSE